MLPRVAILVLNYNGRDCLSSALASLKGLEYSNKQVWVIDNASTDGSLEDAQARFPYFSYLKLPRNYGFAGGMNRGIAAASEAGAEFFWLFNYDARAEKHSLSQLIEAALRYPEAALLSPGILHEDGRIWFGGGRINFLRMRTEHVFAFQAATPYRSDFLTGCALLMRQSAFEALGPLDERFFLYYEDADYSVRARAANLELLVVPQSLVFHSERSAINPKKTYYLVLSGLLFFEKHTRGIFRFYQAIYVTIRRTKNRLDARFGRAQAESVRHAYDDFSQGRHPKNFSHLR